jgi:hypothetical protein
MHCPAYTDFEIYAFALDLWSRQLYPTLERCQDHGLVCDRQRFYRLITPAWKKLNGVPIKKRFNPPSHRAMHYRSPVNHRAPKPEPERMRPEAGSVAEAREQYYRAWRRRRLGLAVPVVGVE